MYFSSQAEYERHYAPENVAARRLAAQQAGERAQGEALALFNAGDAEGARQRLFDAGYDWDGISHLLHNWKS